MSNNTEGIAYLIELNKWGIKNDGTEAVNTTMGINNAIEWAFNNEFPEVVFPKGTYLIDESNSIRLKSYMTLNFNGSTIRVRDNSQEAYQIVKIEDVIYSRLTNGVIEGDRDTHNYVINGNGPGTHEGGTGVAIIGNCRFISIDNLEIFNLTGDAINSGGTFPSLPYYLRKEYCEVGSYSLIDGSLINDNNKIRFTTKINMNDPYIVASKHWGVYGSGYGNLGFDITAEYYDVIFYKLDNSFHSSMSKIPFFDEVPKPEGAAYAKISLYQHTIPENNNNSLWVRVNRHPEMLFIEKLNLHHCRRQGMSLGGKHIYIRDNEIHHIGGRTFQTGTDPQGGIDIEDGYDLNQYFYISGNNFHDNYGYDLVITNGKYMNIEGNRFNKVEKYVSVAINGPVDKSILNNNVFNQAKVVLSGEIIASENTFYGSSCILGSNDKFKSYGRSIEIRDFIFHNSMVTIDQIVPYTVRIHGCKFINDSTKITTFSHLTNTLTLKSEPQIINNCLFDGEDKNYTIYNLNNPNSGWIFENLIFLNITKPLSFPPSIIRNCKFIGISTLAINSSALQKDNAEIELINCMIKSTDQNNILLTLNNVKSLLIKDCFIEKKDSCILSCQNITDQVIVNNCNIRFPSAVFTNRSVFNIQSTFSGLLISINNNFISSSLQKPLLTNDTINNFTFIVKDNTLVNTNLNSSNKVIFNNNIVNGIVIP